jgi:outer membrane protein assembly factor BamA
VQRRFGTSAWLGSRVVWRHYRMQEIVPGGVLEQQSPAGVDGATVAGLGVLATLDTREDVLAPTRGLYLSGAFTAYGPALGGDHDYREAELDARQFVPLAPGWTLALHQYLRMTRGEVPFQEFSLIGNSAFPARMRGYVTGRFRDNDTAILQSELRFPLYRRLSGVGFAAVGDVAPRLTDIRPDRLHWTAGAGLRLRASSTERINLRLDAAFGEGTSGIYFRVFEAF